MNRVCLCTLAALALALSVQGVDPLALPAYRQKVVATFTSSAEASAAQMAVAPLPNGAARAFATRWDDTAPAHIAKATMLEGVGVKGNFYFLERTVDVDKTAKSDDFAIAGARELVRRGHAVGNHTLNHLFMLQLSTQEAYRQILLNRIALEKVLSHTVTSYASPFGWYGNPFDGENRREVIRALVETGHWVSGDNPLSDARQPVTVWMPANRFSANDRNPDYAQFKKGLAQQEKIAAANPDMPRITLGTHSWCDAAGNALQAQWLKQHCVRPDWVQLNDYEYGAYRYSALYAAPAKTGSQAAAATFSVTRFEPTALGEAIPLSISFTETPQSVTCDGVPLVKDAKGLWTLPHAPGRATALVRVADDTLDGVGLTVKADETTGKLVCTLVNGTSAAVRNLSMAVLLPPGCMRMRHTFAVPEVAAGATWTQTVALTRVRDAAARPDFAWGAALYAAHVDFETSAGRARLWARTETAGVTPPIVTPNDVARSTGPFAANAISEADCAALSVATGPLPTTLGGVAVKWVAAQDKNAMWYNLTPRSVHRKGKGGVYVAAFQFKATAGTEVRLPCSHAGRCKIYLNGAQVSNPATVQARAGVNRVLFVYDDASSYVSCLQGAATTLRGLGDPLPCVPFD
ncbi:MAG: polysaccharide deacetylase family protein [Kiritimatiellae bacterium]|nr:polysaccharide deacetylase family protein [Kiritimatiellia bacterium]